MFLKRLSSLVALLPWLAIVAAPLEAWARAGGGQNYGGGGGGGGNNSGGFGGGGLFSFWPLLFFGHGTGFGGLIFLLVIYYLYQQYTQNQARQMGNWQPPIANPIGRPYSQRLDAGVTNDDARGPISVGTPAAKIDPSTIATALAAIKAHDPNFSEASFLDRAQTAFFKVQQAWQARNQDLARDVISDALYERHKMQTDQLIANHQIDVLNNMVIGRANIIGADTGKPYDSIVVAFDASMTDYTIDENTKQIVSGNAGQQTFTEHWTFIRRADAQTTAGQTQLASTCPSCGAPLSLQNGKCAYCGAFVRTSSSDWVVDSIQQV